MMPVIDQGQNDYNWLFAGKENICYCDLPCYLENVFPWNFCNSHTLIMKGINECEQPKGEFEQNFHQAAVLNSYP